MSNDSPTGRLGKDEPALQNITPETELGSEIREQFVEHKTVPERIAHIRNGGIAAFLAAAKAIDPSMPAREALARATKPKSTRHSAPRHQGTRERERRLRQLARRAK